MKKVLLAVVLAAAGWWYFIGGRTLTEDQVRTFYAEQERVTLERDPKALCALLAADFQTTGAVAVGGRTTHTSQNRQQVCDAYVSLYATFDKLGEKMGGILQLDSKYEIHDIALASNKKTATVDISTSLDVAGTIMNIRSRSTDTLIRRNGKVLMLRSEGTGSVRSGG